MSNPKTFAAPAYVLPNLLIAGAQKAGTTDIATILAAHPQVHLPPEKELLFFSKPGWTSNIHGYAARFPFRPGLRYWMDATPGYFWTGPATDFSALPGFAPEGVIHDPSAPKHDVVGAIHSALGPDTRIIVILRHPVKRAISAFFHHFRMGRVRSADRIRNRGHLHGIVDIGMYSRHLKAYLEVYARKQVKVMIFEEYIRDAEAQIAELCHWLGLDPQALPAARQKSAESNSGIKVHAQDGAIRVRDGLRQIEALKQDSRFRKMPLEEPPIVEAEDLAYLARIYEGELETIGSMIPKTRTLWQPVTLETG